MSATIPAQARALDSAGASEYICPMCFDYRNIRMMYRTWNVKVDERVDGVNRNADARPAEAEAAGVFVAVVQGGGRIHFITAAPDEAELFERLGAYTAQSYEVQLYPSGEAPAADREDAGSGQALFRLHGPTVGTGAPRDPTRGAH